MTADPTDALYVYGLMTAAAAHEVTAADPSGRLLPVIAGDVAAVCELVEPETVAAAATDDDQLAALARRHDSVVHLLAGYGATLPARMGTVCAADRLAQALAEAQPELTRQLQLVRGCSEWRLRVTPAAPRESGREERAGARDDAASLSGTEYLRQRRAQRTAVAETTTRSASSFSDLDAVMTEFSTDSGALVQGMRGSARARSYLIADDRADSLLTTIGPLLQQAMQEGEQVTFAGPLPAYSFVELRLEVSG